MDLKNSKSKVIYSKKIDYDNWKIIKNEILINIKDSIYDIITNSEYSWMKDLHGGGLTPNQSIYLIDIIEKNLNKISKNKRKKWSKDTAFLITNSIEGFFKSLVKVGIWEKIYTILEPEKLADLVYFSVEYQLNENDEENCILDKLLGYRYIEKC